MADRALLDLYLITPLGVARASKTLTFYEEDGTTPFGQSLYAAQSGGSPLVAPFTTNSVGLFRAYTPNPQRAVCVASDDPLVPFVVSFDSDEADEVLRGQSDVPLASLIVGPDQTTDIPLIVKGQSGQTANYLEVRNSAGAVMDSFGPDSAALNGSLTIKGTLTSAKIQAAVDAGLAVIIPEGTHSLTTKITLRQGASIRGMGNLASVLNWTGSSSEIMFEYTSGSVTSSHITMANLCLSTTVTDVTGIKIVNGGFEVFENIVALGVATPFYVDGGPLVSLRNTTVAPKSPLGPGGSYFANIAHIEISGFKSFGTSAATAILTFNSVAAGTVTNVNLYAPTNIGIIIEGDCQGIVFTGGVMTSVTKGIVSQVSSAASPTFCEFIGYKIDQASTNSVEVNGGGQLHFTRCEFTNTSGSANGVVLAAQADAIRVRFFLCTWENIRVNGILAVAGAGYFEVFGCNFITCGVSGAGIPLVIGNGVTADVYVVGNWMHDNAHGTIDDAASSGARRYYLDNSGAAPAITTPTGTTVRHGNSLLVDGVEYGLDNLEISYRQQANASLADECFFVANRAYLVTAIREVHSTAGTDLGAVNLQVTLDTSTNAPGAGTNLLTNNANAGFDLKGTANTVQAGTLVSAGSRTLAAGDRLSVDYAGTLTSLAGVVVTVTLQRV